MVAMQFWLELFFLLLSFPYMVPQVSYRVTHDPFDTIWSPGSLESLHMRRQHSLKSLWSLFKHCQTTETQECVWGKWLFHSPYIEKVVNKCCNLLAETWRRNILLPPGFRRHGAKPFVKANFWPKSNVWVFAAFSRRHRWAILTYNLSQYKSWNFSITSWCPFTWHQTLLICWCWQVNSLSGHEWRNRYGSKCVLKHHPSRLIAGVWPETILSVGLFV